MAVTRREFIRPVGGAAALPLLVDAQEPGRTYRIGALTIALQTDCLCAPFPGKLRRAGFDEGHNLQIYRCSAGL